MVQVTSLEEVGMFARTQEDTKVPERGYEPSTSTIVDGLSLHGRKVLLAINGDESSTAAAHVACAMARNAGAEIVAVCAYDPERAFGAPLHSAVPIETPLEALTESVRDDLGSVAREAYDWKLLVVAGAPAEVIATAARELEAAMVVMGLRARSTIERAIRTETVLRVMRETSIPILATTPGLMRMPRRIMAAVDFGRAGVRAARAALSVLAGRGTLDLVFVDRESFPAPETMEGSEVIHRQGVAAAFARLRAELAAPASVAVTTTVLEGSPSEALREFAEQLEPDAIAIGARRHGMLDRVLLGSVTADLVHDGRWSLLIVPPR
jgi:nucleotide-binding universal stress UspA family protein